MYCSCVGFLQQNRLKLCKQVKAATYFVNIKQKHLALKDKLMYNSLVVYLNKKREDRNGFLH